VRWLCFLLALGATIFATMIASRQPLRPTLARHQAQFSVISGVIRMDRLFKDGFAET
jgi:hypothetical protein